MYTNLFAAIKLGEFFILCVLYLGRITDHTLAAGWLSTNHFLTNVWWNSIIISSITLSLPSFLPLSHSNTHTPPVGFGKVHKVLNTARTSFLNLTGVSSFHRCMTDKRWLIFSANCGLHGEGDCLVGPVTCLVTRTTSRDGFDTSVGTVRAIMAAPRRSGED